MKWIVVFGFGLIAGFLIAMFWLTLHKADHLWQGVASGIGAGIGIVVGLTILNQLVGFMDKLISGKI